MKNSVPDALLSQRALASSTSSSRGATRMTTGASSASSPTRRGPTSKSQAAKTTADDAEKEGDDAKKRVRLKPETREQLLERLRNPPLSLHETSILLRVSRATVRRYADAGRLPCLRTPGGQRRFALRDIETFYRQLKIKR